MNLFEQIGINEEKLHPKFLILKNQMIFGEQQIINEWIKGFVDRDNKIVKEFQTTFHSSFWEFYLNALFQEAGFSIDYSKNRPDFIITSPTPFCVEAVVSNIKKEGITEDKRDHNDTLKNIEPFYLRDNFENQLYEAITRYSQSIHEKKNKYEEKYSKLEYINENLPFVIALSGYEQISYGNNFIFPLMALLYGRVYDNKTNTYYNKDSIPKPNTDAKIDIGLFLKEEYSNISAIVFSCTITLGKLTSLAISNGYYNPNGVITIRQDNEFPTYKIQEVSKENPEYLSDGVFIFHNPLAKNPLDKNLFDKTNAVNIFFDTKTNQNLRVANNLPLVSRLNLVLGRVTLPYMYSDIFEKFNPEIILIRGVVSDIEEDNGGYNVTFLLEGEIEKIMYFPIEAYQEYNIKSEDIFAIMFYIDNHQLIMDAVRLGKTGDIRKLKLALVAINEVKFVDMYKIAK